MQPMWGNHFLWTSFPVLQQQKHSEPKFSFFMIHGFTTACWRAHPSPASALNDPHPSFSATTDTWTDGCRGRQTGPAHVLKYTENHWQREWWSTWRGRDLLLCHCKLAWQEKRFASQCQTFERWHKRNCSSAGAAQEKENWSAEHISLIKQAAPRPWITLAVLTATESKLRPCRCVL